MTPENNWSEGQKRHAARFDSRGVWVGRPERQPDDPGVVVEGASERLVGSTGPTTDRPLLYWIAGVVFAVCAFIALSVWWGP